jgi:hypothetical protein
MYLVKFFEEVLGYDSLKGEISKELQIKDRYCDLALKIDGTVHILTECKAASIRTSDKTSLWHAICAIGSRDNDSWTGEVCHGYRMDACGVLGSYEAVVAGR